MRPTFEYKQITMWEFIKKNFLDNTYNLELCKGENAAIISIENAVNSGIINMSPRMYKALTGCKKREVYVFLQLYSSRVQVLTYGDVIPEINNLINKKYKSICLNAGIRASETAFDLPLLAICETGKDKVMRWMVGVLSRNPVTGGCILHEYQMTREDVTDGRDL